MATADVFQTVGVAGVEERLTMRFHSIAEPGALSQGFFRQLVVAEFQTGDRSVVEELQHLGFLCAEQTLVGVDVGGKDERIPTLADGVFALSETPLTASKASSARSLEIRKVPCLAKVKHRP